MEALDGKKNSNMLIAHPTGTGKSLPMLLLGLFLPEGIFSNFGFTKIGFVEQLEACINVEELSQGL